MSPPIKRRGSAALTRRNYEKIRYLEKINPLALELKRQPDGTIKLDKNGKFNARGAWIDGHFFPSMAESDRYLQLKELQEIGTISELKLQPPFPCRISGMLVCTYLADFSYRILPGQLGTRILVEEVKGPMTPMYRLKKKLVKALHPSAGIIEIKVPKDGMERFRFLTADQIGVPEKGDRQTHVKVSARKTGRT